MALRQYQVKGLTSNKTYILRYVVAPLDRIITSDMPSYPGELQPRKRDRAISNAQIEAIINGFDPDKILNEFNAIDRGTPIIDLKGNVLSGNGRTMALRQIMTNPMYRQQKLAYERAISQYVDKTTLAKFVNPVLVRVPAVNFDVIAFCHEANHDDKLGMSPVELALNEGKLLSSELIANLVIKGDIDSTLLHKDNMPFVSDYIGKLPINRQAQILDQNACLNSGGLTALKAAMFGRYFGDTGLMNLIFESIESDIKNITNGLLWSVASFGQCQELINTGQRAKNLDLSQDLIKSVAKLQSLKDKGMPVSEYLNQLQLLGRELTPEQESILKAFDDNKRSGKAIKELIEKWSQLVVEQPNPAQTSLFSGLGDSKAELVARWLGGNYQVKPIQPIELQPIVHEQPKPLAVESISQPIAHEQPNPKPLTDKPLAQLSLFGEQIFTPKVIKPKRVAITPKQQAHLPLSIDIPLNPIQTKIKQYLNGSSHHIDEVAQSLNLPIHVVSSSLVELEINGLVVNRAGFYRNI